MSSEARYNCIELGNVDNSLSLCVMSQNKYAQAACAGWIRDLLKDV